MLDVSRISPLLQSSMISRSLPSLSKFDLTFSSIVVFKSCDILLENYYALQAHMMLFLDPSSLFERPEILPAKLCTSDGKDIEDAVRFFVNVPIRLFDDHGLRCHPVWLCLT